MLCHSLLLLDQGAADAVAAGLVEGEHHAATVCSGFERTGRVEGGETLRASARRRGRHDSGSRCKKHPRCIKIWDLDPQRTVHDKG
jgi:hypothetical protein